MTFLLGRLKYSMGVLASMAVCASFAAASQTLASNEITLVVRPDTAKVKEKITLTATVSTDGSPATGGTVTFFSGGLSLGSIQVVGAHPAPGHRTGTAVLTTILAPGKHPLSASYGGTAQSPDIVRSNRVQLTVTGKTESTVKLQAMANPQNPRNYDFTAGVTGLGLLTPGRIVDFTDITSSTDLGNAPLDPLSVAHGFARGKVVPASGMPAQSVVADFNADGFADVATANAAFAPPSAMAVFLGNGDGSFQSPVTYTTGVFTSGILAADFNRDGIPDIAAMSQGSGSDGDVSIFLGNGDGTFRSPIINDLGIFPVAIALGDFDRDGLLDIASIDYFAAKAYVSLGNGDGTFKTPVPYGVGSGPYSIASADFNNDTFMDLAVVNDNFNTVSVLLGNGDGTFQQQKAFRTGIQVEFVATGDLNSDGNQDMVVANYADKTAGVLLGNGDGTFQPQVPYSVTGYASGLAIADVDGDGHPDIAVSCAAPSRIGVLHNLGDGTFAAVQDFAPAQAQSFQLSIADLNGDGAPDIISDDIQFSISVLINGTTATATLTNVAVPGTSTDTEQIVANYRGDGNYRASKSRPVEVMGSGD